MDVPRQSSLMIRKIIGVRDYLKTVQGGEVWIQNEKFSIKNLYKTLMENPQKIHWAKMMCQNTMPLPKVYFNWLVIDAWEICNS